MRIQLYRPVFQLQERKWIVGIYEIGNPLVAKPTDLLGEIPQELGEHDLQQWVLEEATRRGYNAKLLYTQYMYFELTIEASGSANRTDDILG